MLSKEACACIYDRRQSCFMSCSRDKTSMIEEHFIEDYIKYKTRNIEKTVKSVVGAESRFCLCDGEQVEEVYAYCNLHGLWKC